jgi:calcineurin-like phosphoesterase family protein
MSIVRFIADLHFGHGNMAIKRGFTTVEEHDEHIITKWNSVVNKRDITYILGDITMEKSTPYHLLDRLNGTKKVILGNHDKPSHVPELLKYVNSVGGMVQYKGYILTHCPIHPSQLEFRYSKNIHGHVHSNSLDDGRYINVSAEVVNYVPKTIDELIIISYVWGQN